MHGRNVPGRNTAGPNTHGRFDTLGGGPSSKNRYPRTPAAVTALLTALVASCAGGSVSSTRALVDADSAWIAIARSMPVCYTSMTLDQRWMDRRIDAMSGPIDAGIAEAGGLDAFRYRWYPVCRLTPDSSAVTAYLVEGRGGGGGRDERYHLVTRSRDGRIIADTAIASLTADCSFERLRTAHIGFPIVTMNETVVEFDCEKHREIGRRTESLGSIVVESTGTLRAK